MTLATGVQNGRPAVVMGFGAGVLVGPGQAAPGQVVQAGNDSVEFIGCNLAALISVLVLWAAVAEARRYGVRRMEESIRAA